MLIVLFEDALLEIDTIQPPVIDTVHSPLSTIDIWTHVCSTSNSSHAVLHSSADPIWPNDAKFQRSDVWRIWQDLFKLFFRAMRPRLRIGVVGSGYSV